MAFPQAVGRDPSGPLELGAGSRPRKIDFTQIIPSIYLKS